ncbi:uncharacterized protein LOC118420031 [Branchiostoma floridae]|uniref:Uncharacterized protein LOC118420031 n=1 Tax=Branchiostoma floridae TaxID=7739 RepID=A0A9J7LJ19_BRAFL|nr:uncharacterized protein LOC118420031 [Branchiostoma floridae]
MQLTPVAGASWMVPLILLSNLEIGAGQVTCGSDEFLQAGSCRPCPQCPDGEHLSHECGAGAECVPCPPDYYSNATTRPRCWPCTDCNVENKVQELSCRPNHNAVCGRCLEGYFQFAGRFCHHCSIEPTIPYCVDWLAQQTTTGQPGTTENLWKTSSSTGNKQDVVTDSYVKHYIHWDPGTISVTVILTAIALITAAACIARKWECRCYSGAHDNTIREEPEKQDLGMIEQGITGSQNGGQIHDNDNLGDQSSANLDSG